MLSPSLVLSFALLLASSCSFAPEPFSGFARSRRTGTYQHILYVLKDPLRSDSNYEDPEDEIEEARRRLLASMGPRNITNNTENTLESWRAQLQKAPPLTTVGRERLLVEMDLLRPLATSNNEDDEATAIRNMWYFWYNERGRTNTANLMAADALVKQATPEARKQAEQLYRQLIDQEGLNWAEPLNRLATLLFYEKRYAEAKDLCQMVLTLKPWHFGCQTGIVMVCEQMGDTQGVDYWSRWRMPPLREDGKNSERREWVARMLEKSQAILRRGEKVVQDSFQDVDSLEKNPNDKEEDKEGAWE